jgi:proteasome lid subunit RPN8/RPN11
VFRALVGRNALLRFSRRQWEELIGELGERAKGIRESGAFLLTPKGGDGRTISSVAYYDDLDPNALAAGIALGPAAYSRLWQRCREDKARVAGDAHTHPGRYVCQSEIDRANPMIALAGHVALVVPDLAGHRIEPAQVGVHLYEGTQWRSWCARDAAGRLYVGRWA